MKLLADTSTQVNCTNYSNFKHLNVPGDKIEPRLFLSAYITKLSVASPAGRNSIGASEKKKCLGSPAGPQRRRRTVSRGFGDNVTNTGNRMQDRLRRIVSSSTTGWVVLRQAQNESRRERNLMFNGTYREVIQAIMDLKKKDQQMMLNMVSCPQPGCPWARGIYNNRSGKKAKRMTDL